MRDLFSLIVLVVGVCVSLYFGLYVFFFNGIVNIFNHFNAELIDGVYMAKQVLRVIFSGTVTVFGIFLSVVLSAGIKD